MPAYRIGIDTGGTFSDFCVLNQDTGEMTTTKVPSTPGDPSLSVISGLRQLFAGNIKPEEITSFCYSTTVGTNALLEGKVEKTGVLLTAGLTGINDIYEGAATSWDKYDPYCFRPKSLVPLRLRQEVEERLDFRGNVVKPLDILQARQAIEKLLKQKVTSFAVCLLFSFLNPSHEKQIGALIREMAPGCQVCLSSEVLPQIREYFRLSTTVVDAMIGPVLGRFLARLARELVQNGVKTRQLYIMQSNGGVRTLSAPSATAVPLLLSGPAAGVIAASRLAGAAGYGNVISLDMGGTSCDIGLIESGVPLQTNRGAIDRYDLAIPMLDINTIGAGGGSIASVDKQGILRVGPASAGAAPGPACYNTGGAEPTVTDANLVLGFLNPDYFLGGQMRLYKEMSKQAIEEKVARPLNLGLEQAAHGIIEIINVNMEQGIRTISTERGYDVRDFVLLAFGGAGGLHAGWLAQALKIPRVVIPPVSGVTSAMGLLLSDVRHDYVRSSLGILSSADVAYMNEQFLDLRRKGATELESEGFTGDQIAHSHYLDLRYSGQGYEITVPVPEWPVRENDRLAIGAVFHSLHERQFGHKAEDQAIEIMNYRVTSSVPVAKPAIRTFPPAASPVDGALKGMRGIYSGKKQGTLGYKIYDRDRLAPGHIVPGPAIIEQKDSTVAVFPGQKAEIDRFLNIVIAMPDPSADPE